jgi:hypothetical protein
MCKNSHILLGEFQLLKSRIAQKSMGWAGPRSSSRLRETYLTNEKVNKVQDGVLSMWKSSFLDNTSYYFSLYHARLQCVIGWTVF